MGKRSSAVVLSSDDDHDDNPLAANSSYSSCKSRSSLVVTRSISRVGKKPRLSDYRSRSSKRPSNKLDHINLFSRDFEQVFTGHEVSDGVGRTNSEELWANKYRPQCLEDLAVHKKKVEELRMWFEKRLTTSKDLFSDQVLVVNGQPGSGKSTTIQAIACHLGARLYEWNTPTPVIWQEYLHNSGTGICYSSKLEEFEDFVEKVRKFGFMLSSINEEPKPSILLIDDLPVTNGKVAFRRLKNCLHLLVRTIKVPTAILMSDYGSTESADNTARYSEELIFSLENAGACKVTFNPITVNSIKKVLNRICRMEQCTLSPEHIELIAKSSEGDIRHAITSLQFFCLKPAPMHNNPDEESCEPNDGFSSHFSRDESLSLFHALGKFLHNKREVHNASENDDNFFLVQERLARLPLKMDAPEKVLCQAHGQARPVVDFLHENVLDFLSEEAIDDAWIVSSYLGDSDMLLASSWGMLARKDELESVQQSAAASVAARGVLFGNYHPRPPRWHAIRRPKLWEVEKTSVINRNAIRWQRVATHSRFSLLDMAVMATDYMPVFKCISNGVPHFLDTNQQASLQEVDMKDINLDEMSLNGQECCISEDDDIEEW